jgi:hypothetical protein
VQPTVYFEGMDPTKESASVYTDAALVANEGLNPATVTVGIVALGIVAVAGSATAIYYEVGMSCCSWPFVLHYLHLSVDLPVIAGKHSARIREHPVVCLPY